MGIKQCSKGTVLWKATGLTLKSLQAFGLGNRMDVDGNFLFYSISNMKAHKGKPIDLIVKEMALLLKQIAYGGGFVVTVVMDGNNRPDCKRASWQRRKDGDLLKINRMYCRFKVIELSSKLETEALDQEERRGIETKLKMFNDAAKTLENKSCAKGLEISHDFCQLLLNRLKANKGSTPNENEGYVVPKIIKAKFKLIM